MVFYYPGSQISSIIGRNKVYDIIIKWSTTCKQKEEIQEIIQPTERESSSRKLTDTLLLAR